MPSKPLFHITLKEYQNHTSKRLSDHENSAVSTGNYSDSQVESFESIKGSGQVQIESFFALLLNILLIL